MITSVIIDDEEDGREAIASALTKYCPEVTISGMYATPEEGIAGIRQLKPSLVFLDIQMPEMSGFDVLQQLSPVTFEVIFVSAYDRYAIKAIKFSALDYLLKPIDVDDLVHAVKKVKERLHTEKNIYQYQSVVNNIQLKSGKIEKLAIPSLTGIDFVDTADIIFCRADGSYTTLFLKNKQSCLASKNLKDFEHILAESGFCRIHHSYLINLRHVQKYIKGEGGQVLLTEGHYADVSRRKKEAFLALLDTL
ncbi:LytTR family DNA-binding domain-containing protein [Agriterribacter sp.]|uniref:LytR/AlgR family response regulator transcription factor n=1 Tax=Agriterribacter sp. TaxID=2821509 RepID=UPI002B9E63D9|nr:LytTR family DNA-binding domain-containing protein [Agriterribacter sp.]HRP56282.1 LytTR family DNA-binding domain-containing protein [Agriterribacter sp.]